MAGLLVVVGIVVIGGALGLTSLVIQSSIVVEVNRKLPAGQQFGDAWWEPTKTCRLFAEYRRLYPGGRLLKMQLAIFGVTGCFFVVGALRLLA